MDCSNCGAPLPARSRVCSFCETLNEVDLRTVRERASATRAGNRPCPRCGEGHVLAVLRLPSAGGLEIDRCPGCHGIFFDHAELERLLDASVAPASEADRAELDRLVAEEFPDAPPEVRYVPCPDCAALMHRKAYGARSGVVVDRCREHGVWLDGGELRRLAKWARAGGLAHAREVEAERERLAARTESAVPSVLEERVRRMAGEHGAAGTGRSGVLRDLAEADGLVDLIARLFVR